MYLCSSKVWYSALLAPFLVGICETGDSCSDYKSPVPVKGHMVHRIVFLCITWSYTRGFSHDLFMLSHELLRKY